ncbi:hypothetical protein D1Y84_16055 [Acidipila sp. EB88]|nr:hypothetical protein D1Y84_16055 [Acidipila sp. EB88]
MIGPWPPQVRFGNCVKSHMPKEAHAAFKRGDSASCEQIGKRQRRAVPIFVDGNKWNLDVWSIGFAGSMVE